MIYKIKKVTLHLFFYLIVAVAISLSLVRLFLLGVDEYKTTIEREIFELTEIPVEIGQLQANMRGFNPGIILKDIHILASENKPEHPVQLEEIRFSVNIFDLLWTQELLPSSWLTLVGAKLSVERLEDGSLSIIGLNTGESKQPYWLLNGGRYEVLKSEIIWLDKQRHAAPLKFENIDLLIKNDFDAENHEIHLVSQLPDSIGDSLRVSMSIEGNVFEKDNINGLVYIKGNNLQLAKVVTGKLPLELKVAAGSGSFELWSEWEKSKNIALTGNVQAKNISIKKQQEVYQLDSLTTAFSGVNKAENWQLGLTNLKLSAAGENWPVASFALSGNHQLTQLAASVKQIDLQQFSDLSLFFAPLNKEHKKTLAKLQIKGQIKDFSGYIDTEKKTFAVKGELNNIFTSAYENFPKIENFSASIHGSHELGVIALNTKNANVFFPDIFRKPITIDQLSGLFSWQQLANQWSFESEQIVLDVKDAQTKTRFSLDIPNGEQSAFLDLQSSISNIENVSTLPDYYPASIMTKSGLNWMDNAFISGKIKQGRLLFSGKLNEYPFRQGQGVFEALLDASEVELQYSSDWPHLHNVNAEIAFQQGGLVVTSDHAEVDEIKITDTVVEIPYLGKSDYVLVQGRAVGKTYDGMKFLQQTPLKKVADSFLDAIEPSEKIEVSLKTKSSLKQGLQSKVDGLIKLNKIGLNIKTIDLMVDDVEGDLRFTEKGLFAEKLQAKMLEKPININIDTQSLNTFIKATGSTNIGQLKKQFEFFNSDLLAKNKLDGSLNYQLTLALPSENTAPASLNIITNLQGVSSDLPGWLRKKENEKKKLNLDFLLNDSALLPLSINFNNQIKATMQIDKLKKQLHAANIVLGRGQASLPKDKKVNVQVNQAVFDMTEWQGLFSGNKNQKQAKQIVNKVSIKTQNLRWAGKSFGPIEVLMNQQNEQQWLGRISSPLAEGDFVIPFNLSGKNKIMLEMAYINFSELMGIKGSQQEDVVTDMDFPLIKLFSEKLLWKGENLGTLEIDTERILNGLRFNAIKIDSQTFQTKMRADWIKQGKGSFTNFQGTLIAVDMGKVLSKVGLGNDLTEAKANIEFTGQWPAAPYQFSLEDLEAEIDVTLEDGRIASIEPGFGRALGFLAMEQWVKRLTLDFSDLYKKGLSFNRISGLFTIEQGAAHTSQLSIDSVPAQITISGDTDLLTKTLNYDISVIPKSSGALPIAGTIISGIAGTITQIVTDDYKEGYFFGSKYQVAGKWGDIELKALHEQNGIFKRTWTGFTDLFHDDPVSE